MNYSTYKKRKQIKQQLHFVIAFISICYFFLATACTNSTTDIAQDTTDQEEEGEDKNTKETYANLSYNQNVSHPNILLIIADDMGMDATPYATHLNTTKPNMPVLETIANNGISFNNAWAYPRCTPTRGSIITGKHGYETGLLAPGDVIATDEKIVQTTMHSDYASAVIGKWHLSKGSRIVENLGVDYYKGNTGGGLTDYYNWTLHEDGGTTNVTNYYGTTAYTDFAIDWIQQQTKPWFCWLAYNAAHSTFHTPKDASLYTHTGNSTFDMYIQMLEAMDSEMGRLLENIPLEVLKNTTIIFVGDNGTPAQVAQDPFNNRKSKGSLYNGGVNVPFIVAGANVARTNTTDNALVQTTDLFATIVAISGNQAATNPSNSVSIAPLLQQEGVSSRNYLFAEGEGNGQAFGGYTVRNQSYKLIYNKDNQEFYLFDMINDYEETNNLYDGNLTTEEQNAVTELQNEYQRLKGI